MTVEYKIGNCLEILKDYPDDHFDSCVTDPPYGLEFMGKLWDKIEVQEFTLKWGKQILRVLKPGAHLLSFGGTRTYHRMTCALEDVGFEIRDCLMWLYGSGFPKSLDVSKAIDKNLGAEREVTGKRKVSSSDLGQSSGWNYLDTSNGEYNYTKASTLEAKQWQGWGTALKPAYEPIVLARKPLIGTVAENVLKHGTGGINVDGCRIGFASEEDKEGTGRLFQEWHTPPGDGLRHGKMKVLPGLHQNEIGRWPSNVLLDGESAKMLDEQSGVTKSEGGFPINLVDDRLHWKGSICETTGGLHDEGGASRFFYIAKADRYEREAGLVGNIECSRCKKLVEEGQWPVHGGDHIYNDHPTVKPIEIMRYLVRLVTPRNGVCLDPFVGSGTTLIADMFEGVNGVGIEKDAEKEGTIFYRLEYWKPIAEKRKTQESQERKEQSHRIAETVRTLDLFESEEIEQEDDQLLGDGT